MYSRIYGNEAPGVLVKGGKTGFTNEAGSCLVSYAVTNKGNAYVFCTGGATYRWAPVYDEIYVYKNIIPASAKDLEPAAIMASASAASAPDGSTSPYIRSSTSTVSPSRNTAYKYNVFKNIW